MSEEEESNEKSNNEEENEDEEKEGGEGEENEDDENEEGEEKEDDEEGEENEDEGEEKEDEEEEEDEEDEGKKKKKKKNKKKEENKEDEEQKENGGIVENQIKFPETKLSPTKEIKIDLNLNNSDNIFFNGNDFTLANIIPKKSTLQLLMEISSDMDALTSHLEKVLPPPMKYNIDYKISNPIPIMPVLPIVQNYSLPPVPNYDQEDLEIKRLINKANEMTNNSILNNNNIDINNSMSNNNEVKIFENKGCQSDDEIGNNFHNNQNDDDRTHQEYYNDNGNNRNDNIYPYDPYKHLEYYNDLRNNNNPQNGNNIPYSDNNRIRRMDDFYRGNNNTFRRRPIQYSQPEINNNNYNNMRNMNNQNYNNENDNRPMPFQRYRPGSITQAMDILLDKK